jgi:hypothetical protein
LGHGDVLTAEGRLEFKADKVKEVAEMIENAHAESEESTFVPSRDMDELNYALQCKEHPGHARGYGNRPWKHTLKSTADSYGKRENMLSYSKKRCKKCAEHFVSWEGKDARVISRAYTRIGASTITIIIGPTKK